MAKIIINPLNITIQADEGELFREVLIRENITMAFPCGGAGICGKCRIKVMKGGAKPEYTERETLGNEFVEKGVRLACRLKVKGDMTVELIEQVVDEQILEVGSERGVLFDPYIKAECVTVEEPDLANPVPDAERVLRKTTRRIESIPVLKKLPSVLRENKGELEIIYKDKEIIDIRKAEKKGLYSVGVDIGTTTVVATLVDMKNGRHIHSVSVKNPQEAFGGDVISRIQHCSSGEKHLEGLSSLIREAIDDLVGQLCEASSADRNDIYDIVVVGNTVMNHLFLGIDPQYIAVSPYVPALNQEVTVKAHELGIKINSQGEVFTSPNIAGFVGGDIVAGILDTGILESDEPLLLVDIGTNGEVALGSSKGLTACSTAAGPAFEGVNITHGMRAGKGAIERVLFDEGRVSIETIGDALPRGICGSGIIDVVSQMISCGVIDTTGRFVTPEEITCSMAKRVRMDEKGEPEFVVVMGNETETGEDITVTQKDIRELQLAKGAIASGIKILLDKAALKAEDVKHLLLAGAFGNYIRKESALRIGLFPGFVSEQIKFVGNAAGYGAVMMLLSKKELLRSSEIKDKCEYVEVGAMPEFQTYFAEMMLF